MTKIFKRKFLGKKIIEKSFFLPGIWSVHCWGLKINIHRNQTWIFTQQNLYKITSINLRRQKKNWSTQRLWEIKIKSLGRKWERKWKWFSCKDIFHTWVEVVHAGRHSQGVHPVAVHLGFTFVGRFRISNEPSTSGFHICWSIHN